MNRNRDYTGADKVVHVAAGLYIDKVVDASDYAEEFFCMGCARRLLE